MGKEYTPEVKQKYLDKDNYSLKERKNFYKAEIDSVMNPFPNFNPANFEPTGPDYAEITDRGRETPPKVLPTFGLNPKKVREGQMIGMYESKQDLYLIMAHRCNDLQAQVDSLQAEVQLLKNK